MFAPFFKSPHAYTHRINQLKAEEFNVILPKKWQCLYNQLFVTTEQLVGRENVVGIETTLRAGRFGDEIPRVGRGRTELSHPCKTALGRTQPLCNRYRAFSGGTAVRAWCWPHSYLSPRSGPWWPVIGLNLPFTCTLYWTAYRYSLSAEWRDRHKS